MNPHRLAALAGGAGAAGRGLLHELLRVVRVRRHLALPVHVEREADVAGLGEPHGLVAREPAKDANPDELAKDIEAKRSAKEAID